MTLKQIPMVDLHAQYMSIKSEIDAAISEVIETSAFIRGKHVEQFEERFALLTESSGCVSCANGTDSLYIAMRSLGIKPGDEVIVPAHSWISTSESVTQAGGTVVFCDSSNSSFTINSELVEGLITSKTVGIIPVHLYGQPADMGLIMEIADKHKLWVIEDCAQAHLARYKGKMVGSFGNAASYSFYPGKNLGAMGDAGAITTNDSSLAEKMAKFARHGGLIKGVHEVEGVNSRMDGIQAAILNIKLPYLKEWTDKRVQLAKKYSELLENSLDLTIPKVHKDREHVWHLYVIKHPDRDGLAKYLKEMGIHTAVNYPIALPFLKAYEYLAHEGKDFPVARRDQEEILSIPLYPELPMESVLKIANGIKNYLSLVHKQD